MDKPKLNERIAFITWMVLCCVIIVLIRTASAERLLKVNSDHAASSSVDRQNKEGDFASEWYHILWSGTSTYQRVWPEMKFGWRIVLGSIIGFLGAALGSVGGVGGGGIFVPMLALIIGFDPKSSIAISKCMIMGAAGSTVYYNLRLRHPTLSTPLIDLDLALIFQPMLMLGISIGVTFNVMFADWMVTILLIILFIASSMKAMFKGVEAWKNESLMKEAFKDAPELQNTMIQPEEKLEEDYKPLLSGPASPAAQDLTVSILSERYCKEISLLLFVWVAFLIIQIFKTNTTTCSTFYWFLYALQVPIAVSVTAFEAICLCKGKRVIASTGKEITNWKVDQIVFYCLCGVVAGMVGGLLGLGGGFILGPLFLELGVPPQVASATSTFAMVFSSSMSVVQYYILNRFPLPYAMYFVVIATMSAIVGQHVVRKVIGVIGRASIIIFILASTIFISSISLGGVGVVSMIVKMKNHEYMGFENFCID